MDLKGLIGSAFVNVDRLDKVRDSWLHLYQEEFTMRVGMQAERDWACAVSTELAEERDDAIGVILSMRWKVTDARDERDDAQDDRDYALAECSRLHHRREQFRRLAHRHRAERDADIEAGRRWSRLYQEERDKRMALAKQARAWKVLAWSLRYWVRTKSGKTAPNIPGSIEQTMRAHNANRDFRRENGEARRAYRAKRQGVE